MSLGGLHVIVEKKFENILEYLIIKVVLNISFLEK